MGVLEFSLTRGFTLGVTGVIVDQFGDPLTDETLKRLTQEDAAAAVPCTAPSSKMQRQSSEPTGVPVLWRGVLWLLFEAPVVHSVVDAHVSICDSVCLSTWVAQMIDPTPDVVDFPPLARDGWDESRTAAVMPPPPPPPPPCTSVAVSVAELM